MNILLIQARDPGDPMLRHELECFAERTGLAIDRFDPVNLCESSLPALQAGRWDAVMIGGSGDYSLARGGFDWHQPFLDYLAELVRRDVPTFASCFGFQGLVQAMGGEVVSDPRQAEVGTFRVELTTEGLADPLFLGLPKNFAVQLGHNDSVRNIPVTMRRLASSERCPVQAVRVNGARIVATQFHPELDMEANIVRYTRYLHHYDPMLTPEDADRVAREIHEPSPVANSLLARFVQTLDEVG